MRPPVVGMTSPVLLATIEAYNTDVATGGATGDSSSPGEVRPLGAPAAGLVHRETISRAPESGIWVTVFSHHGVVQELLTEAKLPDRK